MKILFLLNDQISCELASLFSEYTAFYIDAVSEAHVDIKNSKINYLGTIYEINESQLFKKYDILFDFWVSSCENLKLILNKVKTDKYILRSTYFVYASLKKTCLLSEQTALDCSKFSILSSTKVQHYAASRIEYENFAIETCISQNIPHYILRFSRIFSFCDQFNCVSWIKNMALSNKTIYIPQDLIIKSGYINPIFVEDINTLLINLCQNNDYKSGIYNIAQDELLSFFNLAEQVFSIYNKIPLYEVLPTSFFTELSSYKVPIFETFILSNEISKRSISVKYSKTSEWLPKICHSISSKKDPSFDSEYLKLNIAFKSLSRQFPKLHIISGGSQ